MKIKPIKKPVKIKTTKKCKDCDCDVFKENRCYPHYREHTNKTAKIWRDRNIDRIKKYYTDRKSKNPDIKCKHCGKISKCSSKIKKKSFCNHKCFGEYWRKEGVRKGKNNPGYRNGFYTNRPVKKDSVTLLHSYACKNYRKKFKEVNDYYYCENCGTSNSLRFETHHIVFASEKPKHKQLHNHKNLILLCIKCHNKFHSKKSLRNKLVKERNLNDLFGCNLILKDKKLTPKIYAR